MPTEEPTLGSPLPDALFLSGPVVPLHETEGHLPFLPCFVYKASPAWLWVRPVSFWGMYSVL